MNSKITYPRYKVVTILMLLVGLGSSLAIYLMAGSSSENALIEEYEESKRFTHDLEIYGGKANVLADEFRHWFGGLWHGQSLAYTVAVLTVVMSLGYFLVARRLADHAASDAARDKGRDRTD